jgi:ABC-2 type transport system permease protein
MRNIWIIARREFTHYFISPLAYVLSFFFFLVLGLVFYLSLSAGLAFGQIEPDGRVVIGWMVWILLLAITPFITMRLIADEQRMGTLELLLTAPVRDWELILGKWLGSFGFLLLLLAVTWVYPLILHRMTQPGIDQGILVAAYAGLVLLVAAMLAIGTLISTLFSNPWAAAPVTAVVLLVLVILGNASATSEWARQVGFFQHYQNFYQGVIQVSDVAYYLSLTVFCLFLSAQVIQARRWR